MPAEIDVQRHEAFLVFTRQRAIARAKQVAQETEIAAEYGDFGGRRGECSKPGLSIDQRGRCAADQTGEVP